MTDGEDERLPEFTAEFPALYEVAYRVAHRVLGLRVAAEDVAQESLIRANLHWTRIRPETRSGWVARTAANRAIDEVRRGQKRWRQWGIDAGRDEPESIAVERADLVDTLSRLSRRQRDVLASATSPTWMMTPWRRRSGSPSVP